jgi:hypothetical protein
MGRALHLNTKAKAWTNLKVNEMIEMLQRACYGYIEKQP